MRTSDWGRPALCNGASRSNFRWFVESGGSQTSIATGSPGPVAASATVRLLLCHNLERQELAEGIGDYWGLRYRSRRGACDRAIEYAGTRRRRPAGRQRGAAARDCGMHAAQAGMQMPPTKVTVATRATDDSGQFRYQGIAQSSKHIIVRAQVAGVIIARPFVEGTDVAEGHAALPDRHDAVRCAAAGALRATWRTPRRNGQRGASI